MTRAARMVLDIYVIAALFTPLAVAVYSLGNHGAAPNPNLGQLALLLVLLALPIFAMHRLQLFAPPRGEPTLYD